MILSFVNHERMRTTDPERQVYEREVWRATKRAPLNGVFVDGVINYCDWAGPCENRKYPGSSTVQVPFRNSCTDIRDIAGLI